MTKCGDCVQGLIDGGTLCPTCNGTAVLADVAPEIVIPVEEAPAPEEQTTIEEQIASVPEQPAE